MADATAAELIPGLVDILEGDAPGVSMRVVPLTTRDPRRLLDDGGADLAVGYFPAVLADLSAQAQAGPGLVTFAHERQYDGEYVCVMRQGHPLARGPMSVARYCAARHLLVSFSGRPFGFIDEALASIGRDAAGGADGEPVLHRRAGGGALGLADGAAAPLCGRHRHGGRAGAAPAAV
jgi:DNA-binding transcriptional LysR family regulator